MFKYANLPTNPTEEEIKSEIARLKSLANEYKNEEQSIKLVINSIYGGLGNQYFVAHNSDVAESVTLQGQDLLKYSDSVVNNYFLNEWHEDHETHRAMGIDGPVSRVKNPVSVYGDTDSLYISFEEAISSCNWDKDPKDFILELNRTKLKSYLDAKFEEYANRWNTKNYQDFELENISEAGIWLAKKKYLLNVTWESGIDIESLTHLVYKGVELAQSSTPPFAREKLAEIVKYIFKKKKSLQLKDLVTLLKQVKSQFIVADPEVISMGRSVNDYRTYVLNDTTGLELKKGVPIQIRASACYNHALNNLKSGKYKGKYEMIRSGDKVKYYYAKKSAHSKSEWDAEVFAYLPGNYPYEFAPAIDYDMQFEKTIIDPVNRLADVLGLPAISSTLYMAAPLF